MKNLLLAFFALSINCFAQHHEDPRFESPRGVMFLPDNHVYLNCVLTDSLGVPIDLKYYMELDQDTIRSDRAWGEYYKSKYIKIYSDRYDQTGKYQLPPPNKIRISAYSESYYGDTLCISYTTGYYKKPTDYLGINIGITIPNIGTMTIICNLKGYNPIFIEAPFQVGKFKIQYCEEDKIFNVNRPPYTLYHGEFVRLEEEKTIQEEEEIIYQTR